MALYSQIMENAEINNIIKVVGLQYKKSYEDPESLRTLRYGKIMIMTDQVQHPITSTLLFSFSLPQSVVQKDHVVSFDPS